jgi:hypothetical protein
MIAYCISEEGFLPKRATLALCRSRPENLRELGTRFPSSLQKEEKKRFHTPFILANVKVACWTYTLRLPYADNTFP